MLVDPAGFVLICAVCGALGLLAGWMTGVSEGRARERAAGVKASDSKVGGAESPMQEKPAK